MKQIRRALISVSDKTGLVPFATPWPRAASRSCRRPAPPKAAARARASSVTLVEDLTGAAEMLGGRVKTLHPAMHGGILARRDEDDDMASLRRARHRADRPRDRQPLSVPAARRAARRRTRRSWSRTSTSAGRRCCAPPPRTSATSPSSAIPSATASCCRSSTTTATRCRCPRAASWPPRRSRTPPATTRRSPTGSPRRVDFPERLFVEMVKHTELPYGENPHQRAAYYAERGARRHVLSMVHQHGGRGVTFNNIADISAGRDIAREFTLPACVIIKHTNPCGVAMGARIEDAFANALRVRPAVGVRQRDHPQPHRHAWRSPRPLAENFVEVVFAPGVRRGRGRACSRRSRTCASSRAASGAGRTPASATCGGCSAACWCRTTTRSPRTAT